MTRPLTLVAAVGRNGAIGVRNGLPWRLPSDLRRFKTLTMGKPLVLGRKTFESIGRPLPGRHLVVVTRDPGRALPADVAVAGSVDEALDKADALAAEYGADEIMIGGGAEIYRATIGRAARLCLTEVALAPEADAFFPPIDPEAWREASRIPQARGAQDEADFAVVDYVRRSGLPTR